MLATSPPPRRRGINRTRKASTASPARSGIAERSSGSSRTSSSPGMGSCRDVAPGPVMVARAPNVRPGDRRVLPIVYVPVTPPRAFTGGQSRKCEIDRAAGAASRGRSRSAPAAEDPEQEQEQVDEVEVERQRADDGGLLDGAVSLDE